ncbi:SDR family oxidoreductase [Pseudarthrobacter sp. J64]|uniref:SDR family oxidoreductase n=1 Tax=Pseudarthrobacter sp. J64 TaxID=3116485 RepID=UPI002E816842|nr:SDR family oxidoreductase [Pseudarthrobacter sp. J64]MEE2568706.1 SDR family oxidoreductase [Pseudarthrobacter sp. J64]
MDFAPRTAIVTGSDSGIGRATAVELARAGMDVGITWHSDRDGAEHTADQVREAGRKAYVRQLDTSDVPGCGAAIEALIQDLGGVDVFVNNAGAGDGRSFLELDPDTWKQTMDINLNGAFVCIQAAARHMVDAGRGGRIIAVTSVHETQPKVHASAYVAAKHGLGGLIKTIALELAEFGITANSVAPGAISTPMSGREGDDPEPDVNPGIPLGRSGRAVEIAAVVNFLASPAAAYVTGASWPVDGGMLQMGPMGCAHLSSNEWRENGKN